MEQLLHRGSDISDLAYLRVLQLVHFQASQLVEDLKTHELPQTVHRTPYEATEFRRSLTGSAPSAGLPQSAAISTMLETAMEELFVPYTEGQRYMERESKSLASLYGNLLAGFTRFHVSFRSTQALDLKLTRDIRKDKRPSPPCLIELQTK